MISNILLVDDDEDEVNIFTEALAKAGLSCNCVWAPGGLEALNVKPLPDIIFLDLNMPRVDGFECLNDIKKSGSLISVPVVLYSTGMNNELKEKGLLMGATACIAKAYSIADLAETLKQLLGSPITRRAAC